MLALGGGAVALSQSVQFLHFISGMLALELWGGSLGGGGKPLTEIGGFAVTVMTGGPLMVLATVSGLVFDRLFVWREPDRGH